MTDNNESAREWFQRAYHSYVEKHQGCPWCESSYCLSLHDSKKEICYSCLFCDFQVYFRKETKQYGTVPGVSAEDSVMDRVLNF